MRKIIVLVLLFVGFVAKGQIPFEMGAIKIDSVYLNESSRWMEKFSNDTTLTSSDSTAAVSEWAVKKYVDNTAAVLAGSAALQDSLDAHTDTLQSHNDRLKAIEGGEVGYDIVISPDASPDTVITYSAGSFGYFVRDVISEADSIYRLTDTTQSHNDRLMVLEDSAHWHSNKTTLDGITSSYTDADSTRLAGINDTILVMIRVTDDTLSATADSSGWIFPIGLALNGCTLISVEAYSPGEGTGGTAYIGVLRKRSGTIENVTSTGADIGGTATINTAYDDVATADYYNFTFRETGASPNTIAVDAYLKFLRP